MKWIQPTPPLQVAGAVGLWSLASAVLRPTSSRCLLAEAVGTTLVVIGPV